MKPFYHREITTLALRPYFAPAALETVIQANLGQDAIKYQFGHDHFHYDNNTFDAADAYLGEQRRAAISTLQSGGAISLARAAFGRLTHTAQDFYAHSNYTALWREQHPGAAPDAIAPYLPSVINDPRLKSGRVYPPLEYLALVPLFNPLVLPLLPRDSHAWMNKDDPSRPDFAYVHAAAVKRTALELDQIRQSLPPEQFLTFTGLQSPNH